MSEITAGVVLVTKFVSAESAVFSGYIDYINRSNAVRNENIDKYTIPTLDSEIKEYNEYMEYMGDARKTTELFTNQKDRLSTAEKEKLKDIFQIAQDNGSLMWQSVISFDNKWLADNGLYDPESGILNEIKIKEYARVAVNAMLDKEGMADNSIWSASIHYNTDNIHIHIATVQPVPSRETKTIKTIRFNGKWLSEKIGDELINTLDVGENTKAHKTQNKNYAAVLEKIKNEVYIETGKHCKLGDYMQLNTDGSIDISYYGDNSSIPYMAQLQSEKQVQKGVFKESSIEAGKSRMVNKILGQNRINDKINTLMRDTLIDDFKNINIEDRNLQKLYANIYESMPSNKRLWQYNNNVMTPVRNKIDRFTTEWLKQYHRDDFEKLQEYLSEQQQMYQTAYGGGNNNFADNKIRDLYSRCGNIILKNLKELAKSNIIDLDEFKDDSEIPEEEISIDNIPEPAEPDLSNVDIEDLENAEYTENSLSDEEINEYLSAFEESTYLEFSEKYKRAKRALYGTKNIAPDHQVAFELLKDEAQAGNAYAIHDLANCYAKGLGCTANSALSFELYKRALQAFEKEAAKITNQESTDKKQTTSLSYLNYRIGKMYYYGQGTEKNKQKAFNHFSISDDNVYSLFYLAKFYENGEKDVVDKDLKKSFHYYSDVCEKNKMPCAFYKKAYMLEKGLGTQADNESSQENYKTALSGFLESIETRPDDFLQYRVGQMFLRGKGCDINIDEAIKYLELSYQGGNDMAACALADIYIQNKDDPEKIKKAFELLHQSADDNNNVQAQYNLGKLYMDNGETEKALKYLDAAAAQGNQFAQYKLGAYYLENEETELGIKFLSDAAEQDNPYAQYKLGTYYLEKNDTENGIKYLTAAADQNNLFAQYRLGAYYLDNGEIEKGLKLLISSAEQDNLFAQYKLGAYYLKTDDNKKGVDYLTHIIKVETDEEIIKSLKVSAQYTLGSFYLEHNEIEKGIKLLESAAAHNNLFAQYKLGAYYLKAGNTDKGISYLETIINSESEDSYVQQLKSSAQYRLGAFFLDNDNIEKGIDLLTAAAEQGSPFAQYKLGAYYLNHNNIEEGIKYLNTVINTEIKNEDGKDNINNIKSVAEYKLGNYYFSNGDVDKGIGLLSSAAEKGNQFAQYRLGVYYLDNEEIQKGIDYLSSAADQNNEPAKFKLASYYLANGEIQKGINYLIDLSNKDNVFANIKLGNFYSQADFFDFKKAEKYYLKATGKGLSTAEYNLGVLYLSDKDNIRHCLKGMDYLKIAAEQGNEYAMYQLGKVYFYGNKFISPDRELANQYLTSAANKGHAGARYLLNRPSGHRISLPKFHIPYEVAYSLQRLMSELARDYRTHENILNQIVYAKLQRMMEEERE